METTRFAELAGSERRALPGAALVREADPNDTTTVTIYVRPDPSAASRRPQLDDYLRLDVARPIDDTPFRATQADMDAVSGYYRDLGLTVDEADARKRSVRLSGTVGQLAAAFRVKLDMYP